MPTLPDGLPPTAGMETAGRAKPIPPKRVKGKRGGRIRPESCPPCLKCDRSEECRAALLDSCRKVGDGRKYKR